MEWYCEIWRWRYEIAEVNSVRHSYFCIFGWFNMLNCNNPPISIFDTFKYIYRNRKVGYKCINSIIYFKTRIY